jgi:hypothetical protein
MAVPRAVVSFDFRLVQKVARILFMCYSANCHSASERLHDDGTRQDASGLKGSKTDAPFLQVSIPSFTVLGSF